MMQNTNPEFEKSSFNCPFCHAFTYQKWHIYIYSGSYAKHPAIENLAVAVCINCKQYSVWHKKRMIYPKSSTLPPAAEDMPGDVKQIYDEAREVASASPRAAAALLRVALEKLTVHLGETEGPLNIRIKKLKDKGLPEKVIKSLDIVRINANEGGSHAGQIDLEGKDNNTIVDQLFQLINFIVEKTISDNKQIDEMFEKLPENKKQGIDNRDK